MEGRQFHYIDSAGGLDRFLEVAAREPSIGFDTESNSFFAFRERVCLVQASTAETDFILDPLMVDLAPLGRLLADGSIEKVFHAAEYDVLCLTRDYEFSIAGLFDTRLAADSLGWPEKGLSALLEVRLGVRHDKRLQRTDWGVRPLSTGQIEYARRDTRWLLPLRDLLRRELDKAGLREEASESFERLTRLRGSHPRPDPDAFWGIAGARDLDPSRAAVLRELNRYRTQLAERYDRPLFKVFGDATLLALASRLPRNIQDLDGIPGLRRHGIERHGTALLRSISEGLSGPPARPPARDPGDPEEVRARFNRLRLWRKERAIARGVESEVIVPRDALFEIARKNPRSDRELEGLEHLGPYRRRMYGSELLRLLAGG